MRETIPSIYETFETIREQLGVTDRDGTSAAKVGEELTLATINDFILYLYDTIQTLISFLNTLPTLCQYFFKYGFVQRIAGLYEELMPSLDQRYRGNGLKAERTFLKRVKFGLIKICRFIIDAHCLVPLVNG